MPGKSVLALHDDDRLVAGRFPRPLPRPCRRRLVVVVTYPTAPGMRYIRAETGLQEFVKVGSRAVR